MGKLQEFLMKDDKTGKPVETTVKVAGLPIPFTIHSITEAENKEIRRSCQKVTFDKKTHKRETETDNDLYNTRLVIACCSDPNFKDAEFQRAKGVGSAEALVNLILSPGQFIDLLMGVQDVNGFTAEDINDLRDEAKN